MTYQDKTLKQELLKKYTDNGFDSLSEKEILMLILSFDVKTNLEETSDKLLRQYHSLNSVIDANVNDLKNIFGINDRTAALLKTIPQLSKKYHIEIENIKSLNSAENALRFFKNYFIGALVEQFVVACTNKKFQIKDCRTIFSGNITSVRISHREVADFAIKNKSPYVFIAHNHVSGDASPSYDDYTATNHIHKILLPLGVQLVDHIVIGKSSCVSMRELSYPLDFKNVECPGYIIRKSE
ncbi:MAG: hypothetical protein IJX77_04815 [Ruminococcus sp.]|nr:hypothetical protein [Ruminococcus sp.]